MHNKPSHVKKNRNGFYDIKLCISHDLCLSICMVDGHVNWYHIVSIDPWMNHPSPNPTFINLSLLWLWCRLFTMLYHHTSTVLQCWCSAYINLRLCRLFLLDWWWCHERINQPSVNIEEEYSSKNMFAYECLSERKMLHVTNNQYSDAM